MIYIIADYFKASTIKGGNGHENCPYNLIIEDSRSTAEEHLIKRAMTDYNVNQNGSMLMREGEKIWESGDLDVNMADYIIRIPDFKTFRRKANLNPLLSHSRMGATTVGDLQILFDNI